MSAEADRLDREAEQCKREAQQLDDTAAFVLGTAIRMLDETTRLRQQFRDVVGQAWIGPQATRFDEHNEKRLGRMNSNQSTFRAVAAHMRERANWLRDQENQKRTQAAQLRDEERRNREAAGRRR